MIMKAFSNCSEPLSVCKGGFLFKKNREKSQWQVQLQFPPIPKMLSAHALDAIRPIPVDRLSLLVFRPSDALRARTILIGENDRM
jgi:hypothetical protein